MFPLGLDDWRQSVLVCSSLGNGLAPLFRATGLAFGVVRCLGRDGVVGLAHEGLLSQLR